MRAVEVWLTAGARALAFSLLLLLTTSSLCCRAENTVDVATFVIQWIVQEQQGGFLHESISLDPISGNFVTSSSIPKGVLLLEIPPSCMISVEASEYDNDGNNEDDDDEPRDYCRLVDKMHTLLSGNSRTSAEKEEDDEVLIPYLKEQLRRTASTKPTYLWSESAQHTLLKMLSDEESQVLPPADLELLHWAEECESVWNVSSRQDALQLITRQEWITRDNVWVPLMDRFPHRNGNWTNVKYTETVNGAIRIYSIRDISEGEDLTISFYPREEANSSSSEESEGGDDDDETSQRLPEYGSSELFREYGMIEPYPQRWILVDLGFDIDQDENGKLSLSWIPGMTADPQDLNWLEEELERVETFGFELQRQPPSIPSDEWRQILDYRDTLMLILETAAESLEERIGCSDDGGEDTCTISSKFDMLEPKPDNLPYNVYTCEFGQNMEFDGYDEEKERPNSLYQRMSFFVDHQSKDACFDLENIVQICTSYRPHYHEYNVHYTARYLDQVKRVLFVGGGDSMLLHEILQYPDLELVVGLELDQQVTRHSFMHFGTQPHWDNDKVQWWFGDAAKSLLMLPADYFGSFDMVLVDLSETVMSFSVNKGLDIFGAMALLLNEKGIIVKNELYFDKFAEIFDYALQIHFDDVPVICCQSLVLGSYENNFLTQEWKDHGVKPILNILDGDGRYDVWHDFSRNETNSKAHCKHNEPKKDEKAVQETSPGILMILEAEDATGILAPAESLASLLSKTLQDQGLAVRSTVYDESSSQLQNPTVNIVMEEGYVTARTWPEKKYCAFDIHLWSRFNKHDDIKKALLTAVGSGLGKYSSSYRIVAGGMFGTTTWKEDEQSRGPRYTRECDSDDSETIGRTLNAEPSAVATMISEAMKLLEATDLEVLIVCGHESQGCESSQTLQKIDHVSNVNMMYSCEGIEGLNEYMEHGLERMRACEHEAQEELERICKPGKKIQVVVFDPASPFSMGQVIHSLLSKERHRKKYLDDNVLVLATVQDESQEWRRNLMDRFRTDILVHDPLHRADVLFNSSSTTTELDIVLRGDSLFFEHLIDIAARIEKQTGLVSDIVYVKGGLFSYQPDFQATQFVSPEAYDQTGPLQQWLSQQPLGQQTLFQLELIDRSATFLVGDAVGVFYKNDQGKRTLYKGTVTKVNFDYTYDVDFEDREAASKIIKKRLRKLGNGKASPPIFSPGQFKVSLKTALVAVFGSDLSEVSIESFTGIGEGVLLLAHWEGGSITALWDGRTHVDLNLFTYVESLPVAKHFEWIFRRENPLLETVLRDDQPRGYGRVVNYQRYIGDPTEERSTPLWAQHLINETKS